MRLRLYLVLMASLILSTMGTCDPHDTYDNWCDGNKIMWKKADPDGVHMGCSDPIETLADCAEYDAKCRMIAINGGNRSARCVYEKESCPEDATSFCVDNIVADCLENSFPSFLILGNRRCDPLRESCEYFEEYKEARCFEKSEISCAPNGAKKCHDKEETILECLEGKWRTQYCREISAYYTSCVDNGTEVFCE